MKKITNKNTTLLSSPCPLLPEILHFCRLPPTITLWFLQCWTKSYDLAHPVTAKFYVIRDAMWILLRLHQQTSSSNSHVLANKPNSLKMVAVASIETCGSMDWLCMVHIVGNFWTNSSTYFGLNTPYSGVYNVLFLPCNWIPLKMDHWSWKR